MNRTVPYISKKLVGAESLKAFGANEAQFRYWMTHLCGPLGLAMAAKGFCVGPSWSHHELVVTALRLGVFVKDETGQLCGALHHPLLALARLLGMTGR